MALLGEIRKHKVRFSGDYPSYEAAAALIGPMYGDADIIASRLYKTRAAKADGTFKNITGATNDEERILAQIAKHKLPDKFCVVDFGGGFGAAYEIAKEALSAEIYWAVVETPNCVKAAREFETDHLKFFSAIEDAVEWLSWFGPVSMVHVDGVLQYVPEPEQTLKQLVALQAPWMSLLRTVLGPKRLVQIMEASLSWEYRGDMSPTIADRVTRCPAITIAHKDFQEILLTGGYHMSMLFVSDTAALYQRKQYLFEQH